MTKDDFIIKYNETILITGANGYIGSKVIESLLNRGFNNLRCFTRPSSNMVNLNKIIKSVNNANIKVIIDKPTETTRS